MRWNQITGNMSRRLLVNWRVGVGAAIRVLPAGVRPKIVNGCAVAGVCLVRLDALRPVGLPAWTGRSSENLAIRIGIEWGTGGCSRSAVLIFRRETGSLVNSLCGPRMEYGVHHRSSFSVFDDGCESRIDVRSRDGHRVQVHTSDSSTIREGSVFDRIDQAEAFFRGGECGYSQSNVPEIWSGLRLHLAWWELRPALVHHARSTFIDQLFDGGAVFDSAFIMRDIPHTWTPEERIRLGQLPPRVETRQRLLAA